MPGSQIHLTELTLLAKELCPAARVEGRHHPVRGQGCEGVSTSLPALKGH